MKRKGIFLKAGPTAVVLVATLVACSGSSGKDGDEAASPVAGASSPMVAAPTGRAPDTDEATRPVKPGGTPPGGNPAAVQVDGNDAGAVARAAALTMCLSDTEIDNSEYDALLRTAPLLDRGYLAALRAEEPRPVMGGEWGTWLAHRAYTTATAVERREMGQPPDNLLEAFRTWEITVTPHGRDGWEGEPHVVIVFVTLRRDAPDQAWRVMSLHGD